MGITHQRVGEALGICHLASASTELTMVSEAPTWPVCETLQVSTIGRAKDQAGMARRMTMPL
jgi:hypothetical protein